MVDGGAWFGGGERGKRGLFCWKYRRFGRKSPRLQERGSNPICFFSFFLVKSFFFFALVFSSPEFLFFGLSLYVFPISGFLSVLLVCSLFSREFFLM